MRCVRAVVWLSWPLAAWLAVACVNWHGGSDAGPDGRADGATDGSAADGDGAAADDGQAGPDADGSPDGDGAVDGDGGSCIDAYPGQVILTEIMVQPQAVETESDQQNRNLLLSRNAEVDPKPEMEIFADDVTATHGATVGQLDEKALFFLRSRGIDTPDARNLLIFGFANEIIEQIGIAPVRARLEERLLSRLPHTSAMEG